MRVAIDATALGSGRGGDETSLRGVLAGLAAVVPDDGSTAFPLYLRPGAAPPSGAPSRLFPARTLPRGPAAFRYAAALPFLLLRERERPDLLYAVTHAPPLAPAPVALHVHDLSFHHHPEFYPPHARLRLRLLVPLQAHRARVVVVPSEFSRRDVVRTYRLPPGRVFVVPNAVDQPSGPPDPAPAERAAWLARRGIRQPFFLYVGNLHPRKNVARLIEAFARARRACPGLAGHQLAIVGGRWWAGGAEEQAARRAPPGSVVLTGRVPDHERDQLLRSAQALAYPSIFEGFGLPPVEAMAAGTPVLASTSSAMPEVLGDAALLVDPLDVEAIAGGLARLGTDARLRAELRERGWKRAARYTVRATGERALEAFRGAVGVARASRPRDSAARGRRRRGSPPSPPGEPARPGEPA